MPTAKPRIQVTVTNSQYELLKRLAKLQQRSMSAVLSELFDQIEPVYERVAVVLQAAMRAQDSMKDGLRTATESAERELAPMLGAAMGQLDLLMAAAGPAQPGAAATAVGSAALPAIPTPGPVTRGSESPTHTHTSRTSHPLSKVGASRKTLRNKAIRKKSGNFKVQEIAGAIASAVRTGPVRRKRGRK
jgi:hypothetical protein